MRRLPRVLDGDVLDDSLMGHGAAVFSKDGTRRRWLYRFLGQSKVLPPKRVGMIMLNPSDAGAVDDDNTIARCRSFAAWKAGGSSLEVANASDLIETDSKKMAKPAQNWNDANSAHYVRHVLTCDLVIVAWGAARWAGPVLTGLLGDWPVAGLQCLGLTKDGQPKHPLYLRGDTKLEPWPPQTNKGG